MHGTMNIKHKSNFWSSPPTTQECSLLQLRVTVMAMDRKGAYFFMWNAVQFCPIATRHEFFQPIILLASQWEPSCSMRTDEQRDQTKSIISFLHGDKSSDVKHICNNIAQTLIQLWQLNKEKRECFCARVVRHFFLCFFYFVTSPTNQALSEPHYPGNNVCDFTHKTSSVQTMEYQA